MARLVLETGKHAGAEYKVSDGVVMGRRTELPVTIDDPKASREHAKIVAHGDGYAIVDLKCTNGTDLNGSRIQQTRIRDGDMIRIGQTELTFKGEEVPEAAPPAPAAATPVSEGKVDIGQPPPKKLKIDAPPPKTVNVKLTPKKARRPGKKKGR
jgi:pSer/pThr/pTyr-binding forkhead associated (FHA) protein